MSDIYGPVFTLYFGSERVVIAYGYEPVRKILVDNGDDFLDRGRMPSSDKANNKLGMIHIKKQVTFSLWLAKSQGGTG